MSGQLRINSPSVIWDVVDDTVLAIDLRTGKYHQLSKDASIVWSEEALWNLGIDYTVNGRALSDLLSEFVTLGLMVSVDEDHPAVSHAESLLAEYRWFGDGLTVQTFTDLERILALDPIHDVDLPDGWPSENA